MRTWKASKVVAVALVAMTAACQSDFSPSCEALRFSPLEVTVGEEITFDWEVVGGVAQGFAVIDGAGEPSWELLCSCPTNEDGEERCRSEEDWARKQCLEPPLTYGDVPDAEAISETQSDPLEALALNAGQTYTALVFAFCDAEFGGIDRESTEFVAP